MEYAVQTEGLRKVYGGVTAVDNLKLDIPQGVLFGLLGPNGAGKSTTLGILAGWLKPSAGSARVLGTPTQRLHELRGQIAALPQDAAFPPRMAVNHQLLHWGRLMGMGTREAETEAKRALQRVSMSEAGSRLGSELSHGMAKRVGVAQALMGAPRVLFLDEPTAGLDPASAREMKDLIASLAPQATVIVSSHNLAEIQEICTHGAILDKGRLTTCGTIEALTRQSREITVELPVGSTPPLEKLREAFGQDRVVHRSGVNGSDTLHITFPDTRTTPEVIHAALTILLESHTPILGVQRGTSLESAFIELTR
ncbi:MAG: ABC transporter ATP-binding protein [Myxococcota bacterium]|nr:ABC transporter ATP-binding protein [Myxococcota bacterium]